MNCGIPGCPCLKSWRGHEKAPGRKRLYREVHADDQGVHIALSRCEDGIGDELSWHDRYRVWVTLEERGYSAARAARVLACNPRTIRRWRRGRRTLQEV